MGKLIIDGKSVYEIDEECVKRKQIPKECEILDKLKPEWENHRRNKSKNTTL